MFQFRRFPSYTYFIQYMMTKLSLSDCSIRISTDHIMLADPRGFSQLTASFVGSWCQGILPTLLLAWPVWIMFSSFRLLIVVNYPTSKKFLLSLSHNFLICITFTSIIQFSSFCFNYLYQIASLEEFRIASAILMTLSSKEILLSFRPLRPIWWAQVDSNHRPHAYQACALTTWAMRP